MERAAHRFLSCDSSVSVEPDIPILARGKTRKNSSGFTLIELVVVLTLLGIIGGAVAMTLVRQQRFYRGASEMLYAREAVRDATEVLAIDIRGMSISDTVRLLADSAIEMFANIGSSVVCQSPDATEVQIPEASSPHGNTLTSLLTQPDTGDLALFHRDSMDIGAEWERHRIAPPMANGISVTAGAMLWERRCAARYSRLADRTVDTAPTRICPGFSSSTSTGTVRVSTQARRRFHSRESTSQRAPRVGKGS